MEPTDKEIRVYAGHNSAPLWYPTPPESESYYSKVVKMSELTNGVYVDKDELNSITTTPR